MYVVDGIGNGNSNGRCTVPFRISSARNLKARGKQLGIGKLAVSQVVDALLGVQGADRPLGNARHGAALFYSPRCVRCRCSKPNSMYVSTCGGFETKIL